MKETELKNILRKDFNFEANWKPLFSMLFSKVQYFSNPSNPFSENEKVKSGRQTGIVNLDDGKSLAIFEVEVDDTIRIDRNRQGLREIAGKHIDQNIAHGALVFFYSKNQADYRFSFIAKWSEIDLETGEFKRGETKPKRYTYLLGTNEACTTAAKRLLILIEKKDKQNTGIKEIIDAFSVESLNKEFFKTYKEHYEKFWKFIANPINGYRNILLDTTKGQLEKQEKPIRDFTKKLLGRIVFLHFLQKKGWMGCPADTNKWENGQKQFMQQLFAGFSDKPHFHSQCLTRLFFNTLNTKRHNDVIEIDGLTGKLNGSRVPYLNGGLFDADKPEGVLMIDFPEEYFAHLLDFFEQYNFTIDENSPDDHEVGIDPEMLGHIFENLLEENREKGAFYTPKEVVQYMCRESLTQHLKTSPPLEGWSQTGVVPSPPLEGWSQTGVVPSPPLEGWSQTEVVRNSRNYFSLPYNPYLKERAKALRKAGNLSEVLFWNVVKNKQFKQLDFDRQKIIGNYIVDFYCANCNVVIEIDGSSHDEKQEYDAARDEYLKSLGLEVIHIDDGDVKKNLEGVMEMLFNHPALKGTPPKEGNLAYAPLQGTSPKEGNLAYAPLQGTSPEEGNLAYAPLQGTPPKEGNFAYAASNSEIWEKKLTRLVQNKDASQLSQNEAIHINTLLDNVKICDPAIGSGAFPIGMLHEIFEAKKFIYPYLKTNKVFNPAQVKKDIIQNSIYGVDIEKGAVDIAQLRFWLALVVDEENPHPLPNLDYKIMQGNSLLESFEGIDLSKVSNSDLKIIEPQRDLFGNIVESQIKMTFTQSNFVEEIQKLIKHYFNIENAADKGNIRQQIDDLVKEHILFNLELRENQLKRLISEAGNPELLNNNGTKKYQAHIKELQDFDRKRGELLKIEKSNERPYFLWHLFFMDVFVKGGFDIVIGNPPYIQLQKMGKDADILQDVGFETFTRTGDIYCLFYEKGNTILKNNGILAYITSNKWMRAGYGKSTRNYFLSRTQPQLLIDLGSGVFDEATVDTNILIFRKTAYQKPFAALDISKVKNVNNLYQFYNRILHIQPQKDQNWAIASETEQNLKAKIERIGKPLKEWDINIYRGVLTGYNEAFIIDGKKRDELIAADPRSAEIIKPILRGRDIKRYKAEFAGLWLIYIPWHFPLHKDPTIKGASEKAEKEFEMQYPAIFNHLLSHKEKLSARNKAETGIRYEWYALQRWAADYYQEFEREKIVFQEMVQASSFLFDASSNYFCLDTGRIITGKSLKFLISILNSKLFFFSVKNFYGGGGLGETGVRMKHSFFESFQLKELSLSEQKPFVDLVNQILAKKEQGEETSALEAQIDRLVYRLYDLSDEEIAIIEKSTN